jgi:hypothetical protein
MQLGLVKLFRRCAIPSSWSAGWQIGTVASGIAADIQSQSLICWVNCHLPVKTGCSPYK